MHQWLSVFRLIVFVRATAVIASGVQMRRRALLDACDTAAQNGLSLSIAEP